MLRIIPVNKWPAGPLALGRLQNQMLQRARADFVTLPYQLINTNSISNGSEALELILYALMVD